MTAPAMKKDVVAECKRFGERVWDVLAANGHAHHSTTGDGFDVLAPHGGHLIHVVVIDRREGPLRGCGGRPVTSQRIALYRRTLRKTGFGVADYEIDGMPAALVITPSPDTAETALAFALAARDA